MELPYYKIDEVSELLKMPKSIIIRYACSGKININILTEKFTVYTSFQELKHNFKYESFEEYDEYQDGIKEAIAKYEEEFQSDSVSLEYEVFKPGYIKLSKKCLRRYESGELDAKVSIEYDDANDNYFVHFNLHNKNFDIPAIQECELIILKDDLNNFQNFLNQYDQTLIKVVDTETNLIAVMDTQVATARKKKKPVVRNSSPGLELIHYILDIKYKVNYLDELSAQDAWGKIVSGDVEHSLIQEIKNNTLLFNDNSKLKKDEFIEKYRKRFV